MPIRTSVPLSRLVARATPCGHSFPVSFAGAEHATLAERVALWVRRAGEASPRLRLVFRVQGGYRAFEPAALRTRVEPCWAMTVHKTRGSEHDVVALVLPADGDEAEAAASLACREIVYTAITRARRSVVVLGEPAALDAAVGRSLVRWSALRDPARWR